MFPWVTALFGRVRSRQEEPARTEPAVQPRSHNHPRIPLSSPSTEQSARTPGRPARYFSSSTHVLTGFAATSRAARGCGRPVCRVPSSGRRLGRPERGRCGRRGRLDFGNAFPPLGQVASHRSSVTASGHARQLERGFLLVGMRTFLKWLHTRRLRRPRFGLPRRRFRAVYAHRSKNVFLGARTGGDRGRERHPRRMAVPALLTEALPFAQAKPALIRRRKPLDL